MKRTPLKKISPTERKKREIKIDKAYQNFFREVCKEGDIPCEVCGEPMELIHHYEEKSQCVNLRYNPINFIPVCKKCHFKIHFISASIPYGIINFKRGKKWFDKIRKIKLLPGHKDETTYDRAEQQLKDWQWNNLVSEGGQFKIFAELYKKQKHF
jgi:hypothetical protein